MPGSPLSVIFFFFNDTATTEIYTLSLHDALPISYQPTAKGDLVMRGGLGVFYDQINLNPFLDFRPPVSAPSGIQGNPFGATPVSTYSRSGYNWDAVQAGGAAIFPGVQSCSDPLCAAPRSEERRVGKE